DGEGRDRAVGLEEEEPDAVGGQVGAGDEEGAVLPGAGDVEGEDAGGDAAVELDVEAGGGEAAGGGAGEHLGAPAGVVADGAGAAGVPMDPVAVSAGDAQGELGGDSDVGQSADARGAEEPGGCRFRILHRRPRG